MPLIERHQTGSHERWAENHAATAARIGSLTKSLPEMPEAAGTLAQLGAERAAVASLRPDGEAEVCAALRFIAQAGAAAFVSASQAEGEVRAVLGAETLSFPATGPTSTAHVGVWLLSIFAALICRDRTAVGILRSRAAIEAALASSTRGDEFWQPLMQALDALIRADDAACKAHVATARRLIGESKSVDPEFVRATKLPLLDLCECLAARDEAHWDETVAAALTQHRDFWGKSGNAEDVIGFLAFDLAALCALAHDRGIPTHVESPYLPRPGVEGACAAAGSDVTFIFPRRPARDVAEVHRFMDSNGCLEAGRTHELVEKDGALVAVYRGEAADDGPHLIFEFDLVENEDPTPPSLDAGQRMRLADEAAKSVPASSGGLSPDDRAAVHARLEEAVAHWREIIAFIPLGEDRVPESAFWTPAGKALREAEPGRFDRARLEAVLAAWQRLLAAYAEPAAPEGDARRRSLASLEIVREQVQPVLAAIIQDATGAIAAQLAPRPEDYARVFVGEAIEAARRVYGQLFAEGLDIPRPPSPSHEIRSYLAPAGMLAHENELSHHFPTGYRGIARWLNPRRVWVAWKCVPPGQTSGLAFDGLVWCDDHWAWFPKPFRALAPLVRQN